MAQSLRAWMALAVVVTSASCAAKVAEPSSGGDTADAGAGSDASAAVIGDAAPGVVVIEDGGSGGTGPLGGGGVCGCTRRPSGAPSFQCPRGVGESATVVVGVDGGVVSLEGQQASASGVGASVTFPPTTFAAPTSVTLTETSTPPPSPFLDWSPLYRLDPVGARLATPARVLVPDSNAITTVDRNALALFFSADGTTFTRVADSYTNAGFEQGSITQLGYLIVAEERTADTASCP